MDDNGKIDSYELTCALALLSGESLEVNNHDVHLNCRIKQNSSSVSMTMMEISTFHRTSLSF
jgi:hypothetical protein